VAEILLFMDAPAASWSKPTFLSSLTNICLKRICLKRAFLKRKIASGYFLLESARLECV
jgi:hypothetical protein